MADPSLSGKAQEAAPAWPLRAELAALSELQLGLYRGHLR